MSNSNHHEDFIKSLHKLVSVEDTQPISRLSLASQAQIRAFEIAINGASSSDLNALKDIAKMLFKQHYIKDHLFKNMIKDKWNL